MTLEVRQRGWPVHLTENGTAHVAQLVEHVLGKDEVTGSIPVMGSMPLFFQTI
jgi:hypothetical protein